MSSTLHDDERAPERTTIGALLLNASSRWPEKEALVFPGERLTFAQLRDRAISLSRALLALGVAPGDHVGLLMPNCPDFVIALFGAQLIGAVLVPINTRYRSSELAHVIDHADISLLLTADVKMGHVDYIARLYETFPDLESAPDIRRLKLVAASALRSVVLIDDPDARSFEATPGGLISYSDLTSQGGDESFAAIAEGRLCGKVDDMALMLFTSGTTSLPKACMLSHGSVVGCWLCVGERLDVTDEDRVFDPLPLFHMSGIGPTLLCVHSGATLLNMRHFEPGEALELIERERASWLYTIFPPITVALIEHPTFRDRDLASVRAIMNVAPQDTLAVISRAFGTIAHLQGPFGMTEAGGAITCSRLDAAPDERIGSTGKPVAGMEVRVVEPATGAVLGPGCAGELLVRGAGLFAGYYKDSASTEAAVDSEGWLHSGDLGEIDDDGRVTYLGRIKDMLKVGGENVAPSEIESHLSTHPAIKLVQVVGAPHPRLDEVPAAFIELVEGAQLDAEEAIAYCQGRIASFKVPRYVRFVSEWPMSATKVQKGVLREELLAELRDQGLLTGDS